MGGWGEAWGYFYGGADEVSPTPPIPGDFSGWGEEWGEEFGGLGPDASVFGLIFADTIADNVVRLEFNTPPDFTYLEDSHDASVPDRYTITPDNSTTGLDGNPPRPVFVLSAAPNLELDPTGHLVELTVDRPFSPFPAKYVVQVNGLTSGGVPLNPGFVSFEFYGLRQIWLPADSQLIIPSKDFANPQTLDMLADAAGELTSSNLGTYPVDNTGDYAIDEGIDNLRKRIFRRIMTETSAFAHAPGYGIGVGDNVKRLNIPSVRNAIAKQIESQLSQEADVVKVAVDTVLDPQNTNLVRFIIRVKTIQGLAVKFDAPVNTV